MDRNAEIIGMIVGAAIMAVGAAHLFVRAWDPYALIRRHLDRTGIDLLVQATDRERYITNVRNSNRNGGILLSVLAAVLLAMAFGAVILKK